jgi:hypothetical protein
MALLPVKTNRYTNAFIQVNNRKAFYTDENHTDKKRSVQKSTDLYRSTLIGQDQPIYDCLY